MSRVSSIYPASTTTRSSLKPSSVCIDALHEYAAQGAGAQAARRRLFAEDAGQGVALLELLRQRYDVVLMNPPFGAGSLKAKPVFDAGISRRLRMTCTPPLSSEVSSF